MNTQHSKHRSILRGLLAGLSLMAFAFGTGCEESHHGGSGDKKGDIVGTWKLEGEDGFTWYAHFTDEGSWKITNDEAGAERRVYGTYKFNGKSFSGPMTNPRVGTGEIKGTVDGKSMDMDFIEHWHTPYKHVPYTGTKL